jgi:hypothetical protein
LYYATILAQLKRAEQNTKKEKNIKKSINIFGFKKDDMKVMLRLATVQFGEEYVGGECRPKLNQSCSSRTLTALEATTITWF